MEAAVAIVLAAVLSGCAGAPAPAATVTVTVPAPPRAAPTSPTQLLGERYLDAVCGPARQVAAVAAARKLDLPHLQTAAVPGAASARRGADLLAGADRWPPSIRPDVAVVRQQLLAEARAFDRIVGADSLAAARAIAFPDSGASPKRIRAALGLPQDAASTCRGHLPADPATEP